MTSCRLAFHVERTATMGLLTWDYMVDAVSVE
jgi:hypothetical protein